METNPETITSEPVPAEDVNKALTMTDNYVDQGTNKLAQVATIIGGESVKKYGLTNDNIKRVMMFVGAYTSLKFLYEKGFKHKWVLLGTACAIYALRKNAESSTTSQPNKIA